VVDPSAGTAPILFEALRVGGDLFAGDYNAVGRSFLRERYGREGCELI